MEEKQERASDAKARRIAKSVGLVAEKCRSAYHWNNRGGFRLVDPYLNVVLYGVDFELSAGEVIEIRNDRK